MMSPKEWCSVITKNKFDLLASNEISLGETKDARERNLMKAEDDI